MQPSQVQCRAPFPGDADVSDLREYRSRTAWAARVEARADDMEEEREDRVTEKEFDKMMTDGLVADTVAAFYDSEHVPSRLELLTADGLSVEELH